MDENLDNCFKESKIIGKGSIRNYLSYFEINAGLKLNYLTSSDLSPEKIEKYLKTDIFEDPIFNFYWLENSLFYWEEKMINHFERFIEGNRKFDFYITCFEFGFLTLILVKMNLFE